MGLAGVSQVWWMGQDRFMERGRLPAKTRTARRAPRNSLAGNCLLCTPYAVVAAAYIMQVARPASSEALSGGWIPATVGIDDRAGAAAPDAGAAGEPGAFQNAQERAG